MVLPEVPLDANALAETKTELLQSNAPQFGRKTFATRSQRDSIHLKSGPDKRIADKLKNRTAQMLGTCSGQGACVAFWNKARPTRLHRRWRYVELCRAGIGN